jgi:serine O-acetyltransferase
MRFDMFKRIKEDIKTVFEKDPAAKNVLEVLLCYPGLHALWLHRIAHWFYRKKFFTIARVISHINRFFTGIEIHPGAKIGRRVFIDHGMGVVIGETAEIGDDVLLYQGVVLGGISLEKKKRHPTVEDGVVIGAGAIILGPVTIGKGARIGAGSVVLTNVPSHSTAVGVPAKIITESTPQPLEHHKLPDPVAEAIKFVLEAQKKIEERKKLFEEIKEIKEYIDEQIEKKRKEIEKIFAGRNSEYFINGGGI